MTRLLHQAPKRSFRIRTARVEEDAVTLSLWIRVDPLADGARRIATTHGERLDEEMGKRVQ